MNTKTKRQITAQSLMQQIEDLLTDYYDAEQEEFPCKDLRQKLIEEVFSRISNQYMIIEKESKIAGEDNFLHRSLEERLSIETTISRTFVRLLEKYSTCVVKQISQSANLESQPSPCFN